jgi:hypothetical protein
LFVGRGLWKVGSSKSPSFATEIWWFQFGGGASTGLGLVGSGSVISHVMLSHLLCIRSAGFRNRLRPIKRPATNHGNVWSSLDMSALAPSSLFKITGDIERICRLLNWYTPKRYFAGILFRF